MSMKRIYGNSSRLFVKQQKISPLANKSNDSSLKSLKSQDSDRNKASTIDFLSTTSDISSDSDLDDGPFLSSSSSSESDDASPVADHGKAQAPDKKLPKKPEPATAAVLKSKSSNPFEEVSPDEKQQQVEEPSKDKIVAEKPPGSPSIFKGLKPVARTRTIDSPKPVARSGKSARFSAKPPPSPTLVFL